MDEKSALDLLFLNEVFLAKEIPLKPVGPSVSVQCAILLWSIVVILHNSQKRE